MTENMSDNSPSTTKKRKANDGRATTTVSHDGGSGLFSSLLGYFSGRRDEITPTTCVGGENLSQKLDAMMQMMSRMEEKLATVSSLERRCENLEAMLKTKMEQDDSKFDSLVRHHEYNSMIVKNQSWKYPPPVYSEEHWETKGYNGHEAEYLADGSECLKVYTEKMRRGEFPNDYGDEKGIHLEWNDGDPILDRAVIDIMRPHWREFADALKQFTPTLSMLPDGCESYFALQYVQLPGNVAWRLKDALLNKPFQTLRFVNKTGVGDDEGMTVDAITDIVESNEHLLRLSVGNNRIQLDHIAKICSAVRDGSIVDLDLYNCFESGLGDEMVTSLLTSGGLAKLERLGLAFNGLKSSTVTILANFLATNPPLKELDLEGNGLSGDYAELLANALRSNTSLGLLQLYGNTIGDGGRESLRLVLHNDSSLNSLADSNHSCVLEGVEFSWNLKGFWKDGVLHSEAAESFNRARKIYRLLSERNKSVSTSNVQHFEDIDVKLLPFMIKAVQRYAIEIHAYGSVKALSIVHEVMRKWDKVFPLYADRGNNNSI